jgi:hypothetical protein
MAQFQTHDGDLVHAVILSPLCTYNACCGQRVAHLWHACKACILAVCQPFMCNVKATGSRGCTSVLQALMVRWARRTPL